MSTHTRPVCLECDGTRIITFGEDRVECPFHGPLEPMPREVADRLLALVMDEVNNRREQKAPLWLRLLVLAGLTITAWALLILGVWLLLTGTGAL